MTFSTDSKQFWEEKILTWERGRYTAQPQGGSLIERLADRASNSLRFRLSITKELLRPHVAGKRVVELGCGSGLLAADLRSMGASDYQGYDISENAVSHAQELAAKQGLGETVRFEACAVESLPELQADIVFSLGLLDWLDDSALAWVFRIGGKADFLHAISERRVAISQYIHRLYVYLSYGRRTGSYLPRYYANAEMEALAMPRHNDKLYIYRDSRLSFGALISTLPIDETEKAGS